MKKIIAFLLACMLLVSMSSAMAEILDVSFLQEKDIYEVDFNSAGTSCFIESSLSAEARSFTHKYESSALYSSTMFDVLITNYGTSNNKPVFRLWVTYCADKGFQNIDAITFIIGNKEYTFTDIEDPEWLVYDEEDGYMEDTLIRFGESGLEFLVALENFMEGHTDTFAELSELEIEMILHGDEDIHTTLGVGFLLDFVSVKDAYIDLGGLDYLDEVIGSDLKVTTAY